MSSTTVEPDQAPLAAQAPPDPGRRARRAMWWVLGPVLVLVVIGTITAGFVRAPYVMQAPGSARSTEPLISVPAGKGHDSEGDVLFTTVSVIRPTYLEVLWGWWSDEIDVYPTKALYGDQSEDETRQQNLEDMNDSKLLAAKVALEHLGYDVAVEGTGVRILGVEPSVPAAEVLQQGDVVVEADGEPLEIDQDLVDAIAAHEPGDTIDLVVERDGETGRREVTAEIATRPGTGDPFLGVVIETRDLQFDLPFDVGIDSGDVGGPSAGLAFTLGVLDRLTPGSLTGGHRVAVTGAIAADGRVLDVGGVGQKAVAAREAGAEMFLVPSRELELARAHAGDMEVVAVDTLDDALAALEPLGGNAGDIEGSAAES